MALKQDNQRWKLSSVAFQVVFGFVFQQVLQPLPMFNEVNLTHGPKVV